jgi:TM2 domain-containing membrane protein YozV/ribosomal protein L40E
MALAQDAVFCRKCGTEKTSSTANASICRCGAVVPADASFCDICGGKAKVNDWESESTVNWALLLLLSIFLGGLGVDRFYAGKFKTGLLKFLVSILSLGTLAWVWWIADIVFIATEKFKDGNGNIIRRAAKY